MAGEPVSERFDLGFPGEPGRVLRARVTLPRAGRQPAPFVLVLHGFKGFMDWGFFPELARRMARRGMAAVAFNFSGSGIGEDLESFTDEAGFAADTLSRQLEDLERVRAHVLGGGVAGVDPARGALLGHSRGGAVALLHAARHGDYRGAVTWAAVDTLDRYDEATKAAWRREGRLAVHNARTGQTLHVAAGALEDLERNRERLDVLAACRRLRTPVLAFHGGEDESVDASALERILAALPAGVGRGNRVAGAGHTFGARHPLDAVPAALEHVMGETVEWLAQRLGARPA